MKNKNEKIADNAATVGAGYIHFFWNNNVIRGNNKPYIGVLESEVINSMNYYPKNPTESDVQKQPSFIIKYRDDVDKLKAIAKQMGKSKAEIEMITPTKIESNMSYSGSDNQQTTDNQTDVYLRYEKRLEPMSEKKKGKFAYADVLETNVYWSRFTECVDFECDELMEGHKLYPFDGMVWYDREDFAFGQGEVETIIPNQKAVNLIQGMQIEVIKKLGMPPVVVDRTRYKGEVTYDSGKVYGINGDASTFMKVLQPGQINPQTFDLFNVIIQ